MDQKATKKLIVEEKQQETITLGHEGHQTFKRNHQSLSSSVRFIEEIQNCYEYRHIV